MNLHRFCACILMCVFPFFSYTMWKIRALVCVYYRRLCSGTWPSRVFVEYSLFMHCSCLRISRHYQRLGCKQLAVGGIIRYNPSIWLFDLGSCVLVYFNAHVWCRALLFSKKNRYSCAWISRKNAVIAVFLGVLKMSTSWSMGINDSANIKQVVKAKYRIDLTTPSILSWSRWFTFIAFENFEYFTYTV